MRVKPKTRKCKVKGCRNRLTPVRPTHVVCSPECGLILARQKRERQERIAHKADKERVKSARQLMADCQREFNRFIRERDWFRPCISCGRPNDGDHQRHAGHWKTVKARPDIRFNPDNVHAQCSQCNRFDGGGLHEGYKPELIRRIGPDRVATLEHDAGPRRYTREELAGMIVTFRREANALKAARTGGGKVAADRDDTSRALGA